MHEHGKKEYVRECKNHHAQFAGNFKLPPGAIYGRIWDEGVKKYIFFVSITRIETRGTVRIWIRVGDGEWRKEKIPIDAKIYRIILAYIARNGAPILGKYNKPRKVKKQPVKKAVVMVDGKKCEEVSLDGMLLDSCLFAHAKEFDCAHPWLNNFTQYTMESGKKVLLFYKYEDAEAYCIEHGINPEEIKQNFIADNGEAINNHCSYWAIGKDYDRRLGYNKKTGCYE